MEYEQPEFGRGFTKAPESLSWPLFLKVCLVLGCSGPCVLINASYKCITSHAVQTDGDSEATTVRLLRGQVGMVPRALD